MPGRALCTAGNGRQEGATRDVHGYPAPLAVRMTTPDLTAAAAAAAARTARLSTQVRGLTIDPLRISIRTRIEIRIAFPTSEFCQKCGQLCSTSLHPSTCLSVIQRLWPAGETGVLTD